MEQFTTQTLSLHPAGQQSTTRGHIRASQTAGTSHEAGCGQVQLLRAAELHRCQQRAWCWAWLLPGPVQGFLAQLGSWAASCLVLRLGPCPATCCLLAACRGGLAVNHAPLGVATQGVAAAACAVACAPAVTAILQARQYLLLGGAEAAGLWAPSSGPSSKVAHPSSGLTWELLPAK